MSARSTFLCCAIFSLLATTAAAQAPLFDPDDFVDPRQHEGYVVASRLVLGGATDFIDAFRPAHRGARVVHIANSVYTSRFQFDYKHTDVRGDEPTVSVCPCTPPLYFPTPPTGSATPAAPPPGPRETFQFGWYHPAASGSVDPDVMLRYRASWTRQPIGTTVRYLNTGAIAAHVSGDEQTFSFDADVYRPIAGHALSGSIYVTRTIRSGTTDDRNQTSVTWMSRLPPLFWKQIHFHATVAVGGVSGRGGTALNVLSPVFEAYWHDDRTAANVRLIWNPQSTRSGLEGWRARHQVALYVDRRLYLRILPPR